VAGSHESIVQHWPSSQLVGPPAWHVPPPQVSPVVHALPSLHGAVLFVWTQPVDALQVSVVQTLPSSQFGGTPPLQVPPPHVSFVVQALPSLHEAVLLVWTQPEDGLQESSVHGLLSLQPSAGPPLQVPPPHVSAVVQAFPSLHGAVLLVCTQPEPGLQLSSVHGLLSLQPSAGPPLQVPPPQVSFVVHAFPSLHGAVLLVWTQPEAGSHESVVHGLLSSQNTGPPGLHVPPPQVSFVVQAFPSLHGLVLLAWPQPVDGLQLSVVQTLPSSQFGAGPPWQLPPPHVSFVVHAFPSLHGAVLGVWTQPAGAPNPAGLHESSVQGLLSLQSSGGPPWQLPPPHVSFVVHTFPSSHGLVLLV
jgi:hypothetical protein